MDCATPMNTRDTNPLNELRRAITTTASYEFGIHEVPEEER